MNSTDEYSETVWKDTLSMVRATKKRRRTRRMITAGVACAVAMTCFPFSIPHRAEVQVVTRVEVPAPVAMLVVMKISENGGVRLEELSPSELGSMELAFGLAPTIMDGTDDW